MTDILTDAQIYNEYSRKELESEESRKELELEDVRLAIQSKVNYSFTEPPSVEYLLELANQKNATGFLIPEKPRVMLPPAAHCLTAENYQLDVKRKRKRLSSEEELSDQD